VILKASAPGRPALPDRKPFPAMRLLALLIALPVLAVAQPTVSEGVPGTFALTDCRIETVTNGLIEQGTLVIEDGRIAALGAGIAAPAGAIAVPCDGGTVYPGMIEGGSKIGLMEIGAVSETVDIREVGAITPHMQAITAVNVASIHIPIARVNGVTASLATPAGGLIPGTAALLSLHGHSPTHMDLGFRGVIVDFPSTMPRGRFDRRSAEDRQRQAREQRERLTETWEEALLFARIEDAGPEPGVVREYVPEMEALLPVVRGEAPLLIEVNHAQDILDAIEWVQERDVRAVFMGVVDGWRVADRLAASGIPVITGPVHAIPLRESDRYDLPYANAGIMHQAGVQVALRTTSLGMNDTHNTRNLPFHAAFAAAYGAPYGFGPQQALEAVTIVPARIFGLAGEIGSLEVGKRATLFVASGDPLETATQLTHLFIDGYRVPLASRQTELYEQFLNRQPGLEK
jgi:imidazolonepropionase-like amidohydrolase